jgi:flagellar basal body-associated protein FliL
MGNKSSTGLLLGVSVAALAAGSGATWFVSQRMHPSTVESPVAENRGQVMHLEGFTVNLADPEASHFLRLTLDLEVDHLPQGENKEKPGAGLPIPRIRDTILSVLTASKADVLLTREGKAQLKKNLLEALKTSVPELGARDIYFTEFLVQR